MEEELVAAALGTPATMPVLFRRPLDCVLLDRMAYLADRPNGTTAGCVMPSYGQAVEVSFWLADPPRLSHLCVHCPGLDRTDFVHEPAVVCSEKNVAVLEIFFSFGPTLHAGDRGHREYFVYEADYHHPSLRPLPIPYPLALRVRPYEFGLLPGVGDGGFRIAVLRPHKLFSPDDDAYDLHVFSSESWTWGTKPARLEGPRRCLMHLTEKVIVLGEGTLGFVDLWHGILCCNVDDQPSPDLLLSYIPLPPPMESSKDKSMVSSSAVRDVACINGVIKFVEIAHRQRTPIETPIYDGWNAVVWNRMGVDSGHWLLDCEIDVDDVTVSNPKHLALLPDLISSSQSARSTTTLNRNLITYAPAFGVQNGDAFYLKCKVNTTAWVLEINCRMKRLENLASFPGESTKTYYFDRTYCPCVLSKHMNMARKRKERDCVQNVPTDPTILVHGLDPCVTEDQLRNIFTMFGELRGLDIHADQHYASVQFVRRPCAEKAMRIMNGTPFGSKRVAISWEIMEPRHRHADQPTSVPT